jgi:hypothetical protein
VRIDHDRRQTVGSSDNFSACVIEARHLDIKKAFGLTNQKEGWQVQVLLREKRLDDARAATRAAGGQQARQGADCNVSARHSYQWAIIEHWLECRKVLGARVTLKSVRQPLTLDLASLALPTCIWRVKDAYGDIQWLPYALAKYVQDALHGTVQNIPTPSSAPLDADLLHKFLRHVRPYLTARNAVQRFAEIAVFSHLRIEHPTTNTHVRVLVLCSCCADHHVTKEHNLQWHMRIACSFLLCSRNATDQ